MLGVAETQCDDKIQWQLRSKMHRNNTCHPNVTANAEKTIQHILFSGKRLTAHWKFPNGQAKLWNLQLVKLWPRHSLRLTGQPSGCWESYRTQISTKTMGVSCYGKETSCHTTCRKYCQVVHDCDVRDNRKCASDKAKAVDLKSEYASCLSKVSNKSACKVDWQKNTWKVRTYKSAVG